MGKDIIAVFITFLILLTGCTTTGFAGLAKEDYMVEKFSETEATRVEEVTKLNDEIAGLKQQIKEMNEFLVEFESLSKSISNMQEIADKVESRLDKMPEETLIKLLEILNQYLNVEEN